MVDQYDVNRSTRQSGGVSTDRVEGDPNGEAVLGLSTCGTGASGGDGGQRRQDDRVSSELISRRVPVLFADACADERATWRSFARSTSSPGEVVPMESQRRGCSGTR